MRQSTYINKFSWQMAALCRRFILVSLRINWDDMEFNNADIGSGVYETEGTQTTNATQWALQVNEILLYSILVV